MHNTEMSFAKSAALTTRDWDTFQAILRKCLRFKKSPERQLPKKEKKQPS
jgi:hypothetical protein